ncbi:sensor histidine kinase [Halorussus lipolyticus]|uniref:sensor histidine kinase n=1 Tax=Halorussus lipolyticus TaxID=3034024 RepID=UPI0023E8480A|nr:HAMP domain-containing sensor histidine kinase [Halorussus sp. DT80]
MPLPSVTAVSRRELGYLRAALLLGGVLVVVPLCYLVLSEVGVVESGLTPSSLALLVFPGTVLAYLGHSVVAGDVDSEHYPLVARYMVLGILALDLLTLLLILYPDVVIAERLFSFGLASSVGGIGGALLGVRDARLIENVREAQRAKTAARTAERERQTLSFLNSLLRHDVLNGANVILGYAELLQDSEGEADQRHLDTIQTRSEAIIELVENVGLLIDARTSDAELTAMNLSDLLTEELAAARQTHPSAEFTASMPDDLLVRADSLAANIFENLLTNAVEHNDRETPQVHVEAERRDDEIRVRVADNGPGIPEDEREDLFEPTDRGTHGLGLHLVETLVERYEGSVTVEENEPRGTVFVLRFQPVDGE